MIRKSEVLIEAGSLIQAVSLVVAGGSDTIVLIEAPGASIRGNTVAGLSTVQHLKIIQKNCTLPVHL